MQGCEDTNNHTEQMKLRIRGCKDTRLQALTKEHKDMRMRGCKGTSNYTGCEDISKSNMSNMQVTSRLHVGYYNLLHTSLCTIYVYISNGTMQFTFIFWCKIHISISISTIYISVYMIYIYNDTMQPSLIFWCTIHQTLPSKNTFK